ncbi:UDP-N-acetylglucosamine acyltransferase [Streptodolium elevatio]|uniref:UDP-N-acetylglucosamine acyltransferase n=1 Tax=Streptodolium elevatio TaxID=3157996 RepID=A0ABV3DKM8_9ACTN
MGNRIHPTAVIGPGVEIGEDNVIGPYTVIVGPCVIGDGNWIGPHVSIGSPAEFRGGPHPAAWDGELDGFGIEIGSRNYFREFVTVHQGTKRKTSVGDDSYLLVYSHVGHDSTLGNGVTLSSAAQLGGHTQVGAYANIGMGVMVHQFGRIGPGAMVGMGASVRREVPPFSITVGNPARTTGINEIGLSRVGVNGAAAAAMGEYVKGRTPVPDGLPDDIAELLAAWERSAPVA